MGDQKDGRIRIKRPRNDKFLLISTTQTGRPDIREGRPNVEIADRSFHSRANLGSIDHAPTHKAGILVLAQKIILHQILLQQKALGQTILRYQCHPRPSQRKRISPHPTRACKTVFAIRTPESRGVREKSKKGGLTVPLHSRDSKNFGGPELECDLMKRLGCIRNRKALHLQNRTGLIGLCKNLSLALISEGNRAPHHHLRKLVFGCFGGHSCSHTFSAPKNRNRIGVGKHFFQLVRDQKDGLPLVFQALQVLKQLTHFLGSEHGSRFVENQNLRALVKKLQDFDPLLLPDREFIHRAQPFLKLKPVGF